MSHSQPPRKPANITFIELSSYQQPTPLKPFSKAANPELVLFFECFRRRDEAENKERNES
jgi:hypothetical protein